MSTKKKAVYLISVVILITAAALVTLYVINSRTISASDYSKLSWTQSYQKLNEKMSREYAFTQWKSIDWKRIYDKYLPAVRAAQSKNSFEDYYIALRSYLNEIPDGHVRMNNIADIDNKYIGCGFGLTVGKLDDGKIIVTWVDESGPAYAAGIRAGDELTEWNGQVATKAVEDVSTVFTGNSATNENLQQKKLAYLVRAIDGTKVSLVVITPSGAQLSATLTAYDDNGLSLQKGYPNSVLSDKIRNMYLGNEDSNPVPESIVEEKILDGNIMYIKLWAELDADLRQTGKTESTFGLMQKAIADANQRKCTSMILDIRNNLGGLDSMTADILGLFYPQKTLYEYQKTYGTSHLESLYIRPAEQQFTGKIIALINLKCVSCGEGLAMGIKNLPNGKTMGYYGTSGSFGLAGDEVKMPGGITVEFPYGQSLDENRVVQLDSRNGIGGVSPSIRVPMTKQNALRAANGEDVELCEAVSLLTVK
ncbi:S41 family peptidase [Acetanaerobacterium elongatum]|uniref:Carboxyl-terminal processing protease n=1 Tax=Acetanaerobacterium elongatum TaxID=258515 RepID=A0A1H0H9R1_9FIRM|nr:S41 family peptidase [Acetanaerobacterium elongatum]SDO15946.1 carboxyl-terminal processing protease [Acetanaerobacterium elongatum]